MRSLLAGCLVLMVLAASCRRGGDVSRRAPNAVDKLTVPAQGNASITEDKLQRFIGYQREMAPVTAKWMRGGANKISDRSAMAEMQKASENALLKSGLSMSDMQALSLISGNFCGQWSVNKDAQDALSAIARRKADGKPGAADADLSQVHQQTVAEYRNLRAELAAKYGESAVLLLEKYAPQLTEAILSPIDTAASAEPAP